MRTPRGIIGVDLDNTIIDYDALFVTAARDLGLLDGMPDGRIGDGGAKTLIRDTLRGRPDGESAWRRLQAVVYGPRIGEARLMDGVAEFLDRCREAVCDVRIVSHKTRHAAADPGGVDLHAAARGFLAANGIDPGIAVFEETRAGKVRRIRTLACALFIDDLEEVFAEPGFPPDMRRVLFDPAGVFGQGHGGCIVCRSWEEITGHVFPPR